MGTVIGFAGLSDKGRFNYVIAEGDGDVHFGIDSSSGDIYISQPLDYESAMQYSLLVRAEDTEYNLGLNRSVLVSVTVEDVNDHSPWFPDQLVTFGLREDAAVGSLAFAFHARDADGTLPNSALQYSLKYDHKLASARFPFHIDPHTGSLTVAAPLDHETTPSFAFTVTATDQAKRKEERKRSSVTAQVYLLDVNDNRPVFVSADAVQVMEDADVGSLLHHFVAIDGDQGDNGIVSYIIMAGNKNGLFTLDDKTGKSQEQTIDFN